VRKLVFLALFLTLAASAFAGAPEEMVQYKSGKDQVSGFVAVPEGKGPFPAVLVIHEWWGLDDWVKDQARALAQQGYVALAVDLYRGKVTDKQEEAHQLMMGLSDERATQDIKAGLDYLARRADVQKNAIGVIGWCMGGKWALRAAALDPRVAAVDAYYGPPPADASVISQIKVPVLGNYGAEDKGPAPEQVKAFAAELEKTNKNVDIKFYEGAGHAFANENNPWGGYRKEAAKDAWDRTVSFFDKNLKQKATAGAPAEKAKEPAKKDDPAKDEKKK
jgi:carboxymethylenebutenolidase